MTNCTSRLRLLFNGIFYRFYSVLFRKLYDFDIIHTTKHSMFLNLLFRALKRDDSLPRLRSFVKRVLQVCLSSPPQLTCGLLYLVSELLKGRPEVRILNQEIPTCTVTIEDDDDEEEHFKDVDECQADSGKDQIGKEDGSKQASTWVHRNNMHAKSKARTGYDPLARNPIYGRAEQSGGYWEMNLLAAHHHPSVNQKSTIKIHVFQLFLFFKGCFVCQNYHRGQTDRVHRGSVTGLYAHSVFGSICFQKSKEGPAYRTRTTVISA